MYCILTREIYFDDDGWTVYEIMYCCLLALVEMWYLIIIIQQHPQQKEQHNIFLIPGNVLK